MKKLNIILNKKGDFCLLSPKSEIRFFEIYKKERYSEE